MVMRILGEGDVAEILEERGRLESTDVRSTIYYAYGIVKRFLRDNCVKIAETESRFGENTLYRIEAYRCRLPDGEAAVEFLESHDLGLYFRLRRVDDPLGAMLDDYREVIEEVGIERRAGVRGL